MKQENIELFIDRLCALFPGDAVARNTIKAGWRVDKDLLNADVVNCRRALQVIEGDKAFPSLFRVKQVLKQFKPHEHIKKCQLCNGSGWDDGLRIETNDQGETKVTQDRYTKEDELGVLITYVKPCSCKGGTLND